MTKSARQARKKSMDEEALQARESQRNGKLLAPLDLSGPDSGEEIEEDQEILFPVTPPRRTHDTIDGEIVDMVKTLNGAIAAVSQDTARIQRAYQQLCAENKTKDRALANLTAMVRDHGSPPETTRPQPTMQADVMDGQGNMRAADIGISWKGNETFLHGVKVVGSQSSRPTSPGPVTPTHYPPGGDENNKDWSMTAQPPTPSTPDVGDHTRWAPPDVRPGYRSAAPIQRFNNRSLNWPAWFRHFRAVADVHGWNKEQRALQLVGDNDLYNYDVLLKLLSDRFDPASRVSASVGGCRHLW